MSGFGFGGGFAALNTAYGSVNVREAGQLGACCGEEDMVEEVSEEVLESIAGFDGMEWFLEWSVCMWWKSVLWCRGRDVDEDLEWNGRRGDLEKSGMAADCWM